MSAATGYVLVRLMLSLTTGQTLSEVEVEHYDVSGLHQCVVDQLRQVVTAAPPPGTTYVFFCEREGKPQ